MRGGEISSSSALRAPPRSPRCGLSSLPSSEEQRPPRLLLSVGKGRLILSEKRLTNLGQRHVFVRRVKRLSPQPAKGAPCAVARELGGAMFAYGKWWRGQMWSEGAHWAAAPEPGVDQREQGSAMFSYGKPECCWTPGDGWAVGSHAHHPKSRGHSVALGLVSVVSEIMMVLLVAAGRRLWEETQIRKDGGRGGCTS
ncbi:PREDICTED: uncharacterized protein LOC106148461 [Chinchilla lanigera]|uniref:uncharacterized protein LOC106148461 n=1 Tax=Chinchilla lanigera TaxID=34839 RepID=UPI000698D45F|nr:PREDICTED: uncharacterized protein LOC106148461 [Chinchilla lanigera]